MTNYELSGHADKKMSRRKRLFKKIRIRTFLFFFCSMIMFAGNSYALIDEEIQQQATITGTVTDASGEPLPGVSVMIKGTSRGTSTDANGAYSLTVQDGNEILVFSYIGFATQEQLAGNRRTINVSMSEDTRLIEEVVVVGYGTQRKGILTGSVSAVKSDQLTIAPVANVSNALAGQLPGLVAKYTGGQPGADAAQLRIRGFGSPLVIVDGVETSFTNLDASQIESVSILKDGAASIYGARAGHGVILVTTKRGLDQKPTISVNSSYTFQGVISMIKPANSGQRAEMERETYLQSGRPEDGVPWSQEDVNKFFAGNDPAYVNADWFGFVMRPFAPLQNHNISIRGGSDRIKYYGFLGYTDQETMIREKGGSYQRYNIQSNIDAKVTKNWTLSIDFSLIYDNHLFSRRGMGEGGVFWQDLYGTRPWYPTTLPDPTKLSWGGLDIGSAYAMSNYELAGYLNRKNRNIRSGISLEYDFGNYIKGLKAKAYVNYRDDEYYSKDFINPLTFYTYNTTTAEYTEAAIFNSKAWLSEQVRRGNLLTQQFSINYENVFQDDHRVSALLLYESMNFYEHNFSAQRSDFLTPSIEQLYAGSTVGMSNNGSANEMGRVSYVGRLNYGYKDKYLLETIFRADASAKFASDERWGYFPSISVGWVLSQEGFMENISGLDQLKIRAGYGKSGNDAVGNFQYLAGYTLSQYDTYIFGNTPEKAMYSTGLANPILTWEKMTIYNAGIDFSLNNRKIYGTGEVFYRKREGIPASRITSLPSTFGATLPQENLNSINDRGFELSLGTIQKMGDLIFDISGNISWSRAKWDYYEEPEYTDPDQKRIDQRTGKWTDVVYGYRYDKLFTNQDEINSLTYNYTALGDNSALRPGDVRYLDLNDDGSLDWKDQELIGSGTMPHWMYGANVMAKYKNFDLTALFQGAFGYNTSVNLNVYESDMKYKLRWTEANNDPNSLVPRLGGAGSNGWTSDYYYKPTSYIRLKTASLGYELPERVLSKIGLTKLRIYLAGTNLFTISSLSKYGVDPEAPNIMRYYPQQRTYSFGLNLSF